MTSKVSEGTKMGIGHRGLCPHEHSMNHDAILLAQQPNGSFKNGIPVIQDI